MKKLVALFLVLTLVCSTTLAFADNYEHFSGTFVSSMCYSVADFYATSSARALFTILASLDAYNAYGRYLLDSSKSSYVGYTADGLLVTAFYDGNDYNCIVYSDYLSDLYLLPIESPYELVAERVMEEAMSQYEKNESDVLFEVIQMLQDIFASV